MARPTDYTPELLEKAKMYLEVLPEGEAVHTVEGLALALGVTRETVYEWAKHEDKEEFSYIVNMLRTKKSHALQNKALKREVDGRTAGLLLGHEGYRNAQDVDVTSGGEKLSPVLVKFIDKDEQTG